MKPHLSILFFSLLFFSFCKVKAQMPVYDKAKHYQLRSMENGPWEFHPPGWYYSWWTKDGKFLWIWDVKWHLPGLGIHDRGPAGVGGDNYVTRYKPNATQRALMLVTAKKTREKSAEVTASIEEVHKRELLNIADRTVDVVKGNIDPVFAKLNTIFARQLVEYAQLRGHDETFTGLVLEQQKIKETIDYMHSNYVRNADRQKAYSLQLKEMENLVAKTNRILKTEYAYKLTKDL